MQQSSSNNQYAAGGVARRIAWDAVRARLHEIDQVSSHRSGALFVPSRPLRVLDFLAPGLSGLEEEERAEAEYHAESILDEICPRAPLLEFNTDSFGPMSSCVEIDAFTIGDRRLYLGVRNDWEVYDDICGWHLIAVLEPTTAPGAPSGLLSVVLQHIFRSNGEPYGKPILNTAPTDIHIQAPELIAPDAVRAMMWNWMQAVDGRGYDWYELWQAVAARKTAPRPRDWASLSLELNLGLISGAPPPEDLTPWLERCRDYDPPSNWHLLNDYLNLACGYPDDSGFYFDPDVGYRPGWAELPRR